MSMFPTTASARVNRRALFALGGVSLAGLAIGAAPEADAAVTGTVNRGGIVSTARSGIGVRYRRGGTSRSGWDCSGFTRWVYSQHGVNLPRTSSAQRRAGRVVSRSAAQPGDLVCWSGHVGIYAGGNQVIDAGNRRTNTSQRKIWGRPRFVRIGG